MIIVRRYILASILVCFLGLSIASSSASAQSQPSASSSSQIEKEYQFLKDQTKEFQNFVQRELEQQQDFLEKIFVAAFIAGGGLFFWTLQQAKKIGAKAVAERASFIRCRDCGSRRYRAGLPRHCVKHISGHTSLYVSSGNSGNRVGATSADTSSSSSAKGVNRRDY